MSDADKTPEKSPEAGQPPIASAPAALPGPPPASSHTLAKPGATQKLLIGVALFMVLLLGLQWLITRSETNKLKKELARQLQAGESTSVETKNLTAAMQENLKQLQVKVSGLESKQGEAQAQQLALAELYQELAKSRDEWVLSEVEQVLMTANQQLHLSRNVQGALIALQSAEKSLGRHDKPQFVPVRRAIERDINRIKALPNVDISGTIMRIDSVIGQIDKLPLYADERPAVPAVQPKVQQIRTPSRPEEGGAAATGKAGEFWSMIRNKWHIWSNEMWLELRQLIRVRNVEQPEALLVSPEQAYFIRENLKLRLLNARMALLSRSDSTFRSDMVVVQDALNKYFDPMAKQTQAVRMILKQVQSNNLSIEMPAMESLAVVHNFKTKP